MKFMSYFDNINVFQATPNNLNLNANLQINDIDNSISNPAFVSVVSATPISLNVGDLQIGAVEIKNATDDTRAVVGANGLYVDVRNIQAGTNHIGAVLIDNLSSTPVNISSIPTGINIIGKVGIDQTTYGTTNKVTSDLYLSATPVSVTNQIPIRFDTAIITTSITRPTEATPTTYTANDVISSSSSTPTLLTFANVGVANQRVNITGCMCTSSVKQALLPDIDLWLFKVAPTAINDNATLSISDLENENCVTVLNMNSWRFSSNNCRCDVYGLNIPITLASNDTALYGIPVINNAYVPVSAEVFTFTLKVERS